VTSSGLGFFIAETGPSFIVPKAALVRLRQALEKLWASFSSREGCRVARIFQFVKGLFALLESVPRGDRRA
jgi:hypothetical protein